MLEKLEKDCCGCTACLHSCPKGAIRMEENEKGFLMPVIDVERCIECGICESVCRFEQRAEYYEAERISVVYGVKKKTGRLFSQSGGAFALFAEFVLQQAGIVYGVVMERSNVFYQRVVRIEDLQKTKGSKYVQASAGDVFFKIKKDLVEGRSVLFCGTPCYVDGLLAFLKQGHVNIQKLISCDLVCHGVPSPKLFRDYYEYLEGRFGELLFYDFRRKVKGGWHNHIEGILTKDGNFLTSGNYPKLFYSHLELRESCYNCPYASVNRISDLTIGDFWGIEKADPVYDDLDGVSLVLVNSEKGKRFAEKAFAKEAIVREYAMEDCLQPNMQYPTEKPHDYGEFWNCYYKKGFKQTVKQFCSFLEEDYRKETWIKRCKRGARLLCVKIKKQIKFGRSR